MLFLTTQNQYFHILIQDILLIQKQVSHVEHILLLYYHQEEYIDINENLEN